MGTMTLTDFRAELTLALDQRSDNAVSTTRLDRWIGHAYLHMTYPTVHPFEVLKTTYDITLVQDDADYTLAAATVGYQVLAIRSVHHLAAAVPTAATRRARLEPRSVRWYDARIHATGPPRQYVAGEGEQIIVTPTPGSAEVGQVLRLRLWREVAPLTDSTTTVLPDYFDEVLVLGSTALAEFRLGYRDRARETLEHYTAMLNDVRPKETIEADDWGFESQLVSRPSMGVSG